MTPADLEKKIDVIMKRFTEVNAFYISKIAKQVLKIGELIPSSINLLAIMAEMNSDIAEINQMLSKVLQWTMPQVYDLYKKALRDTFTDPRFERALRENPLTKIQRARIEHYTEAVSRQTTGTMMNLSNTTIVSDVYRHTVDNAVLSVSSGLSDYKSATRESIRNLGYNGMQVHYPSGYHRRLDTAVRQNIVDGANQIAQNGSMMMGEMLKYDAIELSAHARSAPDHEPVQGRIFLLSEFDKMQSGMSFTDINGKQYEGFRRPIGEWNCMHIAMSFSTKYSVPRYKEGQLQKWQEENKRGCVIDGKHYTIYQASQLMRRIETQVRKQKDVANAARQVNDMILRKACQKRINALVSKYQTVADASGIKPRKDRMVVEGFKMVKV